MIGRVNPTNLSLILWNVMVPFIYFQSYENMQEINKIMFMIISIRDNWSRLFECRYTRYCIVILLRFVVWIFNLLTSHKYYVIVVPKNTTWMFWYKILCDCFVIKYLATKYHAIVLSWNIVQIFYHGIIKGWMLGIINENKMIWY